ncbi:MAG: protein translocase subunit SecF [Spirochaetales bacterium]|nr:protein translocase subunit SecF [Spirochaetales bacterium]MBO7349777.1 protein translocase subunit SecF [Spirochaetales bacterium]MBP5757484.1 protein translocase subunit SecF [Spirochaetales bacterium]
MKNISFNVVKHKAIYLGIAGAMIILSLALVFFKGFNLGIDFESGLSVSVKIDDQNVGIEDVRKALSGLDGVRVQNIGASDDGRYQIRMKLSEGQDQRSAESLISNRLEARFKSFTQLESNFIGAKFSSSLITGSIKAVAIALALILVYVWIRFKVAYAISSILALIHDVILMLGFISITGFEISSTTIAAILTIIGYSLNNTIVIFDRVREKIRMDYKQDISLVMDFGVNSSLTRTTYSSITTLLAVIPLAVLSSGDVRSFAVCMIFGVIVGTYSSNFVATNILFLLGKNQAFDIMKQEEEDDLSDAAMARRMLEDDDKGRKKKKKEDNGPKILV